MATVDDLQFEGTSFECPPFMISVSVVKAMDFGWYTGTYIKEDYFTHLHKRIFATTELFHLSVLTVLFFAK